MGVFRSILTTILLNPEAQFMYVIDITNSQAFFRNILFPEQRYSWHLWLVLFSTMRTSTGVPLQKKHRSKSYGSDHMRMLKAMLDDGLLSVAEYEEKLAKISASNHEADAASSGIKFMPWSDKTWPTEEDAFLEMTNIKFGGIRLRWKYAFREGRVGDQQRPVVYACCTHEDCPVRAKVSSNTMNGGFVVSISMGLRHRSEKMVSSVRKNARMTFEQEVSKVHSKLLAFLTC